MFFRLNTDFLFEFGLHKFPITSKFCEKIIQLTSVRILIVKHLLVISKCKMIISGRIRSTIPFTKFNFYSLASITIRVFEILIILQTNCQELVTAATASFSFQFYTEPVFFCKPFEQIMFICPISNEGDEKRFEVFSL